MRLWAVLNNTTNKVAWTTTGHPAVFRTRELARVALRYGKVCLDGKVVKLQTEAVEAEEDMSDDLFFKYDDRPISSW